MKRYGWLLFFVLAVPAAIAAIALGLQSDRHPAAAVNAAAMMRIVTLLVIAGTAGGLLGYLDNPKSGSEEGPKDGE